MFITKTPKFKPVIIEQFLGLENLERQFFGSFKPEIIHLRIKCISNFLQYTRPEVSLDFELGLSKREWKEILDVVWSFDVFSTMKRLYCLNIMLFYLEILQTSRYSPQRLQNLSHWSSVLSSSSHFIARMNIVLYS